MTDWEKRRHAVILLQLQAAVGLFDFGAFNYAFLCCITCLVVPQLLIFMIPEM